MLIHPACKYSYVVKMGIIFSVHEDNKMYETVCSPLFFPVMLKWNLHVNGLLKSYPHIEKCVKLACGTSGQDRVMLSVWLLWCSSLDAAVFVLHLIHGTFRVNFLHKMIYIKGSIQMLVVARKRVDSLARNSWFSNLQSVLLVVWLWVYGTLTKWNGAKQTKKTAMTINTLASSRLCLLSLLLNFL